MNEKNVNINWYPGHMAKTKREIAEVLKLIDVVVEILDSRIPISSQNPDIQNVIKNKKKIILLNKCDLADEKETNRWIAHFKKNNITAIKIDANSGKGMNDVSKAIEEVMKAEIEQASQKGRINKTIRVLVIRYTKCRKIVIY